MKLRYQISLVILVFILFTSSCSWIPGFSPPSEEGPPPPFPVETPTLMPVGEVSLTVLPPDDTPANADIALVVLDEVTGWSYTAEEIPMKRRPDGRWEAQIQPAAGSLLRYRYVRKAPSFATEAAADGTPILARLAHIPGSMDLEDIITAWSDRPYRGPTGRVIGRLVDAETGLPLPEMNVNLSGHNIFTSGKGEFRVDNLPPGLHRITAISPDGSYRPAQQGAIIAADRTTPAQMELYRAKKVQVTFELTVPEETLEGAPIRIAGNLRQFGHLFTALPSGGASLASHMPTLIKVDPTHYIQILNLYGGTDLRYKYTLGDGYWNAERDAQGGSRTRQIILPNEDIVVQDEVIQWRSESHEPLNLWVSVPTETPSSDTVSLQLNAGSWSSPLPIWRVGDRDWFYILYGPFQGGLPIQYRYCRNEQCEIADNAETIIRQFTPSSSRQDLKDTVTAWQWWNESPLESVTSIPEIEPRPDLKVGMEIVPAYQPTWDPYFEDAIFRIAELGANAIIFSPTWLVRQENQIPILEFDPVHSPSYETLQSMIQAAQVHGLEVALHPRLAFPSPGADHWWRQGSRDHTWWTTWFERYRSFLLSYAQLAAETEVQKLIIGGSEISPSLPAGLLASGLPSDVPPDALSKWRGLLAEVRATFRGKIAFELALGEELQNPPAFIEHLDEVHIYWHVPITRDGAESQMEMRQKVRTVLENQVLTDELLREKPISLSVEYLSIQGAASGCILDAGGNCIPASDFDLGASPIPNLKLDLIGQERAISAVISEAYNQPQVSGFYVRRYHPTLALQDLSASINGKPADDLLMQWYTQITRP